jgi:saccharopepsin
MKTSALLAVSAAIATASAEPHRMKLNKISLDEQLKSYTMHDMGHMLAQKYGHKLSATEMRLKEMFSPRAGHKVPVNNYMNAQCTYAPSQEAKLTRYRLF